LCGRRARQVRFTRKASGMHVVYGRCAAIDVGEDKIAVAVRVPGDGPDGRVTVKRTFRRLTESLCEAAWWLVSGAMHVAIDTTGVYSMLVYHALLQHGDFAKVLIRIAAHVENVRAARRIMPTPNGWRTRGPRGSSASTGRPSWSSGKGSS